jgi:uncharacterized protein (DUF934 family)
MALIRDGALSADPFATVPDGEELPEAGAVLVSLQQWQQWRDALVARDDPVGIRLASDQHPEVIADDLDALDLVALEFPVFRDGRPYSYARLLRDRYGFTGELRAVGDVLIDQLLYMHRVGFNAFELAGDDPLGDYQAALGEFSVVYQLAGDDRVPALRQRHGAR